MMDEGFLRVLRRSDYTPLAIVWIGAGNSHQWGIEPDGHSVSSVGNNDPSHQNASLHFTRFSLPYLVQLDDTVLAQNVLGGT